MEKAKHNRAVMEAKGFRVKIQKRIGGKWADVDIDQTKLGSET